MRIFWQSFVDATASAPYMARLAAYLNEIAAPGTVVDVHGISPPNRDFGRLTELRGAVQAIDNGLQAEDDGYDAFVIGHFQDPGLYDLRSAVRIPVIGAGESSMFAALQLGRRLGLVTLADVFGTWHYEQADLYGIGTRIAGVTALNCEPADFSAAFDGNKEAHRRMLDAFAACAEPLVARGADVIIPAGVLPGLLVASEHGLSIGHAPIVNCAAVALKNAEMWVQLRALNGTEPSRGPSYALAGPTARADFRRMVAQGRGGGRDA